MVFWEWGFAEGSFRAAPQTTQLQWHSSRCRWAPLYLPHHTSQTVQRDPVPTAPNIHEHPQTPEWGGHTYMCQHILLITRKTTKCTARITKEQQKSLGLFLRGGSLQILWILYKSHGVAESVVFADITIQLHNVCSLVVHEGGCVWLWRCTSETMSPTHRLVVRCQSWWFP